MGPLSKQIGEMEAKSGKDNKTLFEPIKLIFQDGLSFNSCPDIHTIQVSAHKIETSSYIRECQTIFPFVNVRNMIALPTMQHAPDNLASYVANSDYEKNRLRQSVSIFSLIKYF